jgi:protein O-mannosyl-transferase
MDHLYSSATTAPAQPTSVSRPESLFGSREKRKPVLCLVLALATLGFYNPIIHNSFTDLDDYDYIKFNDHVRAGLTWSTVRWGFTSFEQDNWHPLTWLSHALDCQLFGLNPAGPHYETVILHAANSILLFLLLENATAWVWPSFMVAALFALHPVNVESVAWASERKNVLSMLFFLLALHAYGWYVRRVGIGRFATVAALFALGLMAKPEIITLPFVLLLWDYWPLRRMFGGTSAGQLAPPRSFGFLLLEKLPLLLLSVASGVVTFLAQSAGKTVRAFPLRWRYGNTMVAYVRYVGKAFWPSRLAAFYPHRGPLLPTWEIWASTSAVLLVTALFLHWRARRYLLAGWFWFLGTLVPVIGIVQVGLQSMADRYAYLPYVGLFVCVVWAVAEAVREQKIGVAWWAVPSVLLLATLGLVSRHQLAYWRDSQTLWKHALDVTPEGNFVAHDGLARALVARGQTEEAIAEFKEATSLHGYRASKLIEIGMYEQEHGHAQDAIQQYGLALSDSRGSDSRATALTLLGSAFMQVGDLPRAEVSYASALQENPNSTAALLGSGLLAERDGDSSLAVARISRAMQVEPTDVGYLVLEDVLRRAGRSSDADEAEMHARRISHDLAQAQQSVRQILSISGVAPE